MSDVPGLYYARVGGARRWCEGPLLPVVLLATRWHRACSPTRRVSRVDTDQGYADPGCTPPSRSGRSLVSASSVKLGCGGETTASFLSGQGNAGDALLLGCDEAGGSQMVAAERFLRQHHRRGEVALLTLDIGANDIDGCDAEGAIDATCVITGAAQMSANLPVIMRRLRRAAAPGTPMAAMTLYNPFLALYLTPSSSARSGTAIDVHNVNEGLARLYRASSFRVAHVDTAFHTYDISRKTSLAGQPRPVPVAVAGRKCADSLGCARPLPRDPTSTRTRLATGSSRERSRRRSDPAGG